MLVRKGGATLTALLTDAQLTAIKERLAKATPGPWSLPWDIDDPREHQPNDPITILSEIGEVVQAGYGSHGEFGDFEYGVLRRADADFIAHAPDDIDALLQHIEALQADPTASLAACQEALVETMGELRQVCELLQLRPGDEEKSAIDLAKLARCTIELHEATEKAMQKRVRALIAAILNARAALAAVKEGSE